MQNNNIKLKIGTVNDNGLTQHRGRESRSSHLTICSQTRITTASTVTLFALCFSGINVFLVVASISECVLVDTLSIFFLR